MIPSLSTTPGSGGAAEREERRRGRWIAAAGLFGYLASACSSSDTLPPPSSVDASTASNDSGSAPDAASPMTPAATACAASDAGPASVLSFVNETYKDDPRSLRKDEAIFTGLNTLDDPYKQMLRLTNNGVGPVTITSIGIAPQSATTLFPATFRQHSNTAAFEATIPSDGGSTLPATMAAGESLDIEVQFLSTKTSPPTRFDNTGGEAVAAWLVAQTSNDCAQAGLYGVSLWNNPESISDAGVPTPNYGRYEPTLGQIIATLGYQVDVGENLKTYLNANQVSVAAMDPPPAGDTPSDEVIIRDFVVADPARPAVLLAPARFAPKVDFPFGYFLSGSVSTVNAQPAALAPLAVPGVADFPQGLQYVAAMSSVNHSDNETSDHSEMLFPPIDGNKAGTFSPSGSFGLWCFGAQRSDGTVAYDGGVNPNTQNGDYDYSYDELNITTGTANPSLPSSIADAGVNHGMKSPVHRYRVWPLKDRVGNRVANSYLIALEEATNDDYQDMVFTLSNVKPAPTDDAGSGADAAASARTEAGTD